MSAIVSQEFAFRILLAGGILLVTLLIDFTYGRLVSRAFAKRNRNSAYEISRVGSIVIWVAGVLSILPIIGASDTVVAVVVLLVGAYLILATKDLTSNWFSGQMIKTVAPFKVGDWIKTPDASGRVTRIESIFTTLVTRTNETILIPNSKLAAGVIIDRSSEEGLKVPIEIEVENTFGFDRASVLIRSIARELSSNPQKAGELDKQNGEGLPVKPAPEIYFSSQDMRTTKIRVVLRVENPIREEELVSEFKRRFSELRETELHTAKNYGNQ